MRRSLAIIGEGPTEWHYIDSLRITKRYPFRMCPSVPQHTDMRHMLAQVKKCLTDGFDEVICLLDMDRLNTYPTEMQAYHTAKKQKTFSKVTFIETDPCTEYWFLLHYLRQPSSRCFASGDDVIAELKKHLPNYEKTERYLERINLYEQLNRNNATEHAIELSKQSVAFRQEGVICSYTEMFKLFEKLETFTN